MGAPGPAAGGCTDRNNTDACLLTYCSRTTLLSRMDSTLTIQSVVVLTMPKPGCALIGGTMAPGGGAAPGAPGAPEVAPV